MSYIMQKRSVTVLINLNSSIFFHNIIYNMYSIQFHCHPFTKFDIYYLVPKGVCLIHWVQLICLISCLLSVLLLCFICSFGSFVAFFNPSYSPTAGPQWKKISSLWLYALTEGHSGDVKGDILFIFWKYDNTCSFYLAQLCTCILLSLQSSISRPTFFGNSFLLSIGCICRNYWEGCTSLTSSQNIRIKIQWKFNSRLFSNGKISKKNNEKSCQSFQKKLTPICCCWIMNL